MFDATDLTNISDTWARDLGMASFGMYGIEKPPFDNAEHRALLDGVRASFTMSTSADAFQDRRELAGWAWSAYMRKHVWVNTTAQEVTVVSVARDTTEKYKIAEVNNNLERFLEYLSNDRHDPKFNVLDLVLAKLDYYREGANSVHERGVADEIAISALMLGLAKAVDPNGADLSAEQLAEKFFVPQTYLAEVAGLGLSSFEGVAPMDIPRYNAGISVRHAGGSIFQRATARITYDNQLGLFSQAPIARFGAPSSLQLGGYFTPPGLARSLAEAAVKERLDKPALRICDPACGSGVFLAEVLRALSRENYQGTVTVVGRDILPLAVNIARFVVRCAALDFGADRVTIDIEAGDSLTSALEGGCDIVLMNPPFRSWEQSDSNTKDVIKHILGDCFKGKPDYSLAFAQRAYDLLADGGTLATLLPAGVLAADYSQAWRQRVTQDASIDLIATLGDHYLFEYALVNIAALVIHKQQRGLGGTRSTQMLWASENSKASDSALRGLRRSGYHLSNQADEAAGWRSYNIHQMELLNRTSWAPNASSKDELISELRQRNFPTLGQLFRVQQGVRTGSRSAFVLPIAEYNDLPSDEKLPFRPIAEKDGIHRFKIEPASYLFYADDISPSLTEEDLFAESMRTFYERRIVPNLSALRARPRGKKIWELSESRAWLKRREPRIVSRMFIGKRQYGFAVDELGAYAVVQGYGWTPTWKEIGVTTKSERLVALYAYAFLFSSDLFFDMVRSVSVNIAGGQFDLAPKYIDSLPIPDWDWIKLQIGDRLVSVPAMRELGELFAKSPLELERFARKAFGVETSSI